MRNLFLAIFFCVAMGLPGHSQPNLSPTETTSRFLATLSADELAKTTYAFDDSLRFKWTNLPVGLVPRPGIAYGSLSDKSRMAFHRVLSSLLSSQGYLKTTSIMQLDDILNTLYQQAFDKGEINQNMLKRMQDLQWAHGNFFISIWGKPSAQEPWGLNFGGHHMALNATFRGNQRGDVSLLRGDRSGGGEVGQVRRVAGTE